MSLNRFKEDECFLTTHAHCPCVEFVVAEGERHGFHTSQLLHYHLEPKRGQAPDDPPETLTLAFATADVIITGWRLDRLADPLRNGELLAVRACSPKPRSAGLFPGRYASVEPANCLVASITVTPVGKQ